MYAAGDLFEDHVDRLRWRSRRCLAAKSRVVPFPIGRTQKLRLPFLVLILDDDAQPRIAIGIGNCTQCPHTGPVHVHETIDTFARPHEDDVHGLRIRHRIAVERYHLKFMAGQRDPSVGRGARVQEMK